MKQTQPPASAPAREALPMQVDVKIHALHASGPVLADASVNLNGCFAIRGVKVVDGSNGPFVSMPSYKGRDGYKDICFPCTSSTQAPYPSLPGKARKLTHSAAFPLRGRPASLGSATMFHQAVLDAYQQTLAQIPQRQQERGGQRENGVPAANQRSVCGGERRSSEVSESCRLRQDEGYGACDDAAPPAPEMKM